MFERKEATQKVERITVASSVVLDRANVYPTSNLVDIYLCSVLGNPCDSKVHPSTPPRMGHPVVNLRLPPHKPRQLPLHPTRVRHEILNSGPQGVTSLPPSLRPPTPVPQLVLRLILR